MSEEPSPDSGKSRSAGSRTAKFAVLAGVLGIAAGAGLYAFSGLIGNVELLTSQSAQAGSGSCKLDQTLRASLDEVATGDMAAFQALDRAVSVADLSFRDEDGNSRSLGDWKGKTVLLNLWATWCAPCRAEMPALDALQAEMGGGEFEVVPVSVDLGTADKPKKFYRDIGMKSAGFFHDGEMTTLNDLKKQGLAYGLPATLLINRNGCVLGTLNGPAEWASEEAKTLVRQSF